jgi:hypothetical protein
MLRKAESGHGYSPLDTTSALSETGTNNNHNSSLNTALKLQVPELTYYFLRRMESLPENCLLPRYRHTPLRTPRSFRVLRLKEKPHDEPHTVVVEIEEMNLGGAKFDALSYTWGAPTADKWVVCNGAAISVTTNCHTILEELSRDSRYLDYPIFVDAVCIDQVHLQERNHQVKIMGDIFSGAQRVVCWLGDLTWEGDRMSNFLKEDKRLLDEPDQWSRSHREKRN